MMTNLFSIFDPSTPNFLSMNWSSMLLFSSLMPLSLWVNSNRFYILTKKLSTYVFSEFSPLIKKSPYLLIGPMSFFIFVMYNNLFGLLPYTFTATSHMTVTLALALPSWLAVMAYGWFNNTSNLLAHLIPQGTPSVLMPFMVLIESVSSLIRPMTLALRLMANMVAGHLLIVLLSSAFSNAPVLVTPILTAAQVSLSSLELAVAFIQAYIFSVLVTLYAAESIN
nr:ATP synthase F0 subunit 6 [Eusirus cf. giganteus clade g1]